MIVVGLLRGAWGGTWTAEKALSATRAFTCERDHRLPQEHVFKKTRNAFHYFAVLQIRGLGSFSVGYLGRYNGAPRVQVIYMNGR